MSQPWCLVVKTNDPAVLPVLIWKPAFDIQEIFGCRTAYYNPYHWNNCPHRIKDSAIGFYGVDQNLPKVPVCEISADHIETIATIACTPGYAYEQFQQHGWDWILKNAVRIFHPNILAIGEAA